MAGLNLFGKERRKTSSAKSKSSQLKSEHIIKITKKRKGILNRSSQSFMNQQDKIQHSSLNINYTSMNSSISTATRSENVNKHDDDEGEDFLPNDSGVDTAMELSSWTERRSKKKIMLRKRTSLELLRILKSSILNNTNCIEGHYAKIERRFQWLRSFQALDPRFQIMGYFEEIARQGGPLADPLAPSPEIELLRGFAKAAAFTVWRPTSREAIAKMMKFEATGKGLDIKGKSAKCGKHSGLIPFLQIHHNDHKDMISWPPSDGRMRVFYKTIELQATAVTALKDTATDMQAAYARYVKTLQRNDVNTKDLENDVEDGRCFVEDFNVYELTESGIGLDVPERVFFRTYITKQNISRVGTGYETGRPSEPAFQDMNFSCTRCSNYKGHGPRAIVYQTCAQKALCPQSLVIAYEENYSVTPVASDFDCFTVGTRGVVYDEPLPNEQVDLMKWLVNEIDLVLANPGKKHWTNRWLDVLKNNAHKSGSKLKVPEYGYGDPKSYAMMEGAVSHFIKNRNGAVRHGAECFNYGFPQELDDQFLIISDSLVEKEESNVPWKYVDAEELKTLLIDKIDDGFCFPLNPKWILADKGWKQVYDKMIASEDELIQCSLETWFPRESGIREQIEAIHARHPDGFVPAFNCNIAERKVEGMHEMDLASEKMRRYIVLQRAKSKVRAALSFMALTKKSKKKRNLLDSLVSEVFWKWILLFLTWGILSLAINSELF